MQAADFSVDLAPGHVFYRDSGGAGAPVVFLHAASGNSALWDYQISAIGDAGFRFVALDHLASARGSNSSALLAALLDHQIGRAHV